VPASFGAERGHETKWRSGGRRRLLTKGKRGNGGGGPARATPRKGMRGGWRGLAPVGVCDRQATVIQRAREGGPQLGRCHGPTQAHIVDFNLK
jgi:hypothetical protein